MLVRDKGNFLPGCVQIVGVRHTQATEPSLNCRFITEIEFKLLFLKKERKERKRKQSSSFAKINSLACLNLQKPIITTMNVDYHRKTFVTRYIDSVLLKRQSQDRIFEDELKDS